MHIDLNFFFFFYASWGLDVVLVVAPCSNFNDHCHAVRMAGINGFVISIDMQIELSNAAD